MSGHGWVTPNADGSRARCGGPALCRECARELGAKMRDTLQDFFVRREDRDIVERLWRLDSPESPLDEADRETVREAIAELGALRRRLEQIRSLADVPIRY